MENKLRVQFNKEELETVASLKSVTIKYHDLIKIVKQYVEDELNVKVFASSSLNADDDTEIKLYYDNYIELTRDGKPL